MLTKARHMVMFRTWRLPAVAIFVDRAGANLLEMARAMRDPKLGRYYASPPGPFCVIWWLKRTLRLG